MYYLVYRLIFIMQIKTIKWHLFTALQKYLCMLDSSDWCSLGKAVLGESLSLKPSRRQLLCTESRALGLSGHLMGFAGDSPKSAKLRPDTFPLKFYNWIPINLPYFIVHFYKIFPMKEQKWSIQWTDILYQSVFIWSGSLWFQKFIKGSVSSHFE